MQSTPSIVRRAFAPETQYTLDLEGMLLLESLDCALVTGSRKPGLRDTILALLVLTDLAAVKKARSSKGVQGLIDAAVKGRKPAELFGLQERIVEAIKLACEPAPEGGDVDPDDPISALPKKPQDAAGG